MAMSPKAPPPQPRFSWIGQYGWFLGLFLAGVAIYQSTPLMTGQLSSSHAEFEKKCATCHISHGVASDEACLQCHDKIRAADSPSAIHRKVNRRCSACHQEHRSRQYPLRMADPLSFDHDQTGFPLKKFHSAVACSACHRPGKPYYSVQKRCADCHPKWDRTTFDHGKVTRVTLRIHSNQACSDCHPGQRYEVPPTCTPCHEPKRSYHPGDQM